MSITRDEAVGLLQRPPHNLSVEEARQLVSDAAEFGAWENGEIRVVQVSTSRFRIERPS
jgi:hypothetical protein